MELRCGVRNYEWGKLGPQSLVAEFLKSSEPGTKIDSGAHYAELWMGCHPSVPSRIKKSDEPLLNFIEKNPSVLGENVIKMFGKQIPFLFKILSINEALSIQAHPSKKLAKELHKKEPDIYRDDNHKPEMAVALTPFEALCGFKPICEIRAYLKAVPELKNLVTITAMEDDFMFLKNCLQSILKTEKEKIKVEVENLVDRLTKIENVQQRQFENVELVLKLNEQFPGDVGIFMVYFLNHIKLKPGEALYLAECEPHAYISGECVECMACSDNVVRAGLTPKFIDVDTLVSMLTYQCTPPEEKIFVPHRENHFTSLFIPPVPDFAVAHIQIPAGKEYTLVKRTTASITIVTSGKGKSKNVEFSPGRVIFVPADQEITLDVEEDIAIFQAFVNV